MYLLGIVILAAIVYFIVRPGRQRGYVSSESSEAEDILKKRFVSGEIDKEIYKNMLRTLRG